MSQIPYANQQDIRNPKLITKLKRQTTLQNNGFSEFTDLIEHSRRSRNRLKNKHETAGIICESEYREDICIDSKGDMSFIESVELLTDNTVILHFSASNHRKQIEEYDFN